MDEVSADRPLCEFCFGWFLQGSLAYVAAATQSIKHCRSYDVTQWATGLTRSERVASNQAEHRVICVQPQGTFA